MGANNWALLVIRIVEEEWIEKDNLQNYDDVYVFLQRIKQMDR